MTTIDLDVQNDGSALILTSDDAGEPKRLATVYRLKDGWHTKLTAEHTRHAWAGPFESPEEALQAMRASISKPA
jgi:hypothetical protein